MPGTTDHTEDLLNNEWHDQGACLLRHSENQRPECKYPKNCRDWTIANRKVFFQRAIFHAENYKKVRYLRRSSKTLTQENKKTGKKREITRDTSPTKPKPGDDRPTFWDIDAKANGVSNNFKPSGPAHYPYRHQWHHIIPSAALYEYLLTTDDPKTKIKLHYVLMTGKYNLNHGRNVVLLPEEEQVGKLVQFPTHPNNHPEFSGFAKTKLGIEKRGLSKALSKAKGNVHKVDTAVTGGVAENIHKISEKIWKLIEAFGRLKPGLEINELHKYEAQIRKLMEGK